MSKLIPLVTTVIDPDVEFPKVEKILYSLAWKFASTYPVTFEEAKSEAYYAYVRACADFKPSRGTKFSTWVYTWAWQHMKTWITKRSKDPLCFVEMDDDLCGGAVQHRSDYLELVADLGEDAKEIVRLLIEVPYEAVGHDPATPKQLLARVKNHMVAKGRSKEQIDEAHRQLVATFQAAWA